jgi:hypothetical protein
VTPSADVPECTACGACCFSTLPEYIRVFGVDCDRMDGRARAMTHFIDNQCFMRIEGGRCVALVIETGERQGANSGARFLCSIYEQRPDCCRALERGSGACRGERHEKRERPLIAVAALLRGR